MVLLDAAVAPAECLNIFNYFERRIVLTLALTACRITHTHTDADSHTH